MAIDEAALSLASTAGQAIVTAAATDVWDQVKRAFARLVGQGDQRRIELTERRLEQVREELAGLSADQRKQVQDRLVAVWQTRLLDLLEEHPYIASELGALVERVYEQLPTSAVSVADHSVAAGRDVTITASGGGVAAGVIHGNVAPPDPTWPGLASD